MSTATIHILMALAADASAREDPVPPGLPIQHERIETLIGADVLPSSGTLDESGRPLEPDAGEPLGTVDELLIGADGHISWAVVHSGDRRVLVPFKKLAWDGRSDRFRLDASKSLLGGLAAIDLDQAKKGAFQKAVQDAQVAWKNDLERSAEPAAARKWTATSLARPTTEILCGSEFDELELLGANDEFGGVTKSLVNPARGCVELLVVSRGGVIGMGADEYLVPFEALSACRKADADEPDAEGELMLCSELNVNQLQQGPRYEKPETDGVLVSEANRSAALRFYGIEEKYEKGEHPAPQTDPGKVKRL